MRFATVNHAGVLFLGCTSPISAQMSKIQQFLMLPGGFRISGQRHSRAEPIQLVRMKKPLIFLMCLPLLAHAEWGDVERDFEQVESWVEGTSQLPAYPSAESLLPFTVSSATRNRYFVDAASIDVGADGVIRYTAVIEAAGGAKNVSYEGLRCESGEYRLYAYGHPDGTWSKARHADWEAIKFHSLLSYQKVLYEDYFCPGGIQVRDSKEAIRNLRQATR